MSKLYHKILTLLDLAENYTYTSGAPVSVENNKKIKKFFDGKCKADEAVIIDAYIEASQVDPQRALKELMSYAETVPLAKPLWANAKAKSQFLEAVYDLEVTRFKIRDIGNIAYRLVPRTDLDVFMALNKDGIQESLILNGPKDRRKFLTKIVNLFGSDNHMSLSGNLEQTRKEVVQGFVSEIFDAAANLPKGMEQIVSNALTQIMSVRKPGDTIELADDTASKAVLVSLTQPDERLLILCEKMHYNTQSPTHSLRPVFMGTAIATLVNELESDITRLKPPIPGLTPHMLEQMGEDLGYVSQTHSELRFDTLIK